MIKTILAKTRETGSQMQLGLIQRDPLPPTSMLGCLYGLKSNAGTFSSQTTPTLI